MRISDWSSDVCSSDLLDLRSRAAREQQRHKAEGRDTGGHQRGTKAAFSADPYRLGHASPIGPELAEIGYHDQPVEHRDAKQGDKSHRRWNRQILPRNNEREEDGRSTRLNTST